MQGGTVKILIAFALMAALGAGQTARAEGPLPLKQGSYVREEVPCNEATNANRIYYENLEDGYGISWPHSACIITHVHKKGNIHYVTQKCIFKGITGEITKHLKITIKNETSFSILNDADEQKRTKKIEQVYRWCQD